MFFIQSAAERQSPGWGSNVHANRKTRKTKKKCFMLFPMMLCEFFSAGGSGVFLQGRHVLALNTTLTSCVRSQPSLCLAAAIPDWGCLAMQSRWGEPLSALSNDTHVKRTSCLQQNQLLLNEYTSSLSCFQTEQNMHLCTCVCVCECLFRCVCVSVLVCREVCVSTCVFAS